MRCYGWKMLPSWTLMMMKMLLLSVTSASLVQSHVMMKICVKKSRSKCTALATVQHAEKLARYADLAFHNCLRSEHLYADRRSAQKIRMKSNGQLKHKIVWNVWMKSLMTKTSTARCLLMNCFNRLMLPRMYSRRKCMSFSQSGVCHLEKKPKFHLGKWLQQKSPWCLECKYGHPVCH